MMGSWRISAYNAVLVAAYIIPAWVLAAWDIVGQPIRGFYAPPNIAFALFTSDHLQLAASGTLRAAWALAIMRLTVVAFFAVFLLLTLMPRSRRRGDGDEALGIALMLAIVVSMAGMVLAGWGNEPAALRLHASETLLLLTAGILLLAEPAFSRAPKAGALRQVNAPRAGLRAGARTHYGLRGASSSNTAAASLKA